uniref:Calmodulin n=1 Tax=Moniliophthora roreri TaxID=221103 RepID=A0A0W0G933_MONRR
MPTRLLSFLFVTLFSTSYALQVVTRSNAEARTIGQLSTDDAFKIIDSNKDGKITVIELQEAAAFMWKDLEASNRARITFDLSHPADFILSYDLDGDGKLSKEEFSEPMREMQLRSSSSECKNLSERLDTCKTHEIIQCSAYISTAEHMCRLNHRNVVEQCILSSPCGSICKCIAEAERAAHGESVMVLQYPDGHEEYEYSSSLLVANSTFALGHPHEKRFLFAVFLGLVVASVLNIAISAALISASEIQQATGREVGFMDFDVWDSGSNNPPPKCSVYVFWSTQCGAIGSGKARGCSHGGTRLYSNSCKDHFRYGSRGCGFLDLGCRSLCYGINDEGCPCSYFDNWRQQDNTDFPGNDLETLHVQKLSDCRSACASSPSCRAFVVPPADGTENQINCYLKGELGSFRKSTGTTSFIKVFSNAKTCPSSLVGEFGIFDRREQSEPVNALVPRIDDNGINGKAFPFDANDITFLVIARFLQALYNQLWINREQVQRTSFETTLNAIGTNDLTPVEGEPVANTANPRWRVSDGWRAINVFRNLLNNGRTSNTPVADFINAQPTSNNDNLDRAVMPQQLRQLLIANEEAINRGTLPWAGSGNGRTDPYPGVQVTHAGRSNLGYYQGGAMGPFPLEAAFILATQLAGINWRQFAQRGLTRPAFWLNAVLPRGTGDQAVPQCLRQYADGQEFNPDRARILGFMSRDGIATGGPREGFYVIIDVDGERNPDTNPGRNVFVFAVQTIDPHSRINVPNANNLRNLQYTNFDPVANPDAAPAGPEGRAQQRFFAHAHAAWVPYNRLRDFMTQDPNGANRVTFPGYTQIGEFHLYILSENESNIHPRFSYLNNDNGGRKHDELSFKACLSNINFEWVIYKRCIVDCTRQLRDAKTVFATSKTYMLSFGDKLGGYAEVKEVKAEKAKETGCLHAGHRLRGTPSEDEVPEM